MPQREIDAVLDAVVVQAARPVVAIPFAVRSAGTARRDGTGWIPGRARSGQTGVGHVGRVWNRLIRLDRAGQLGGEPDDHDGRVEIVQRTDGEIEDVGARAVRVIRGRIEDHAVAGDRSHGDVREQGGVQRVVNADLKGVRVACVAEFDLVGDRVIRVDRGRADTPLDDRSDRRLDDLDADRIRCGVAEAGDRNRRAVRLELPGVRVGVVAHQHVVLDAYTFDVAVLVVVGQVAQVKRDLLLAARQDVAEDAAGGQRVRNAGVQPGFDPHRDGRTQRQRHFAVIHQCQAQRQRVNQPQVGMRAFVQVHLDPIADDFADGHLRRRGQVAGVRLGRRHQGLVQVPRFYVRRDHARRIAAAVRSLHARRGDSWQGVVRQIGRVGERVAVSHAGVDPGLEAEPVGAAGRRRLRQRGPSERQQLAGLHDPGQRAVQSRQAAGIGQPHGQRIGDHDVEGVSPGSRRMIDGDGEYDRVAAVHRRRRDDTGVFGDRQHRLDQVHVRRAAQRAGDALAVPVRRLCGVGQRVAAHVGRDVGDDRHDPDDDLVVCRQRATCIRAVVEAGREREGGLIRGRGDNDGPWCQRRGMPDVGEQVAADREHAGGHQLQLTGRSGGQVVHDDQRVNPAIGQSDRQVERHRLADRQVRIRRILRVPGARFRRQRRRSCLDKRRLLRRDSDAVAVGIIVLAGRARSIAFAVRGAGTAIRI